MCVWTYSIVILHIVDLLSWLLKISASEEQFNSAPQDGAMRCRALQCAVMCWSELQSAAVRYSAWQSVAVFLQQLLQRNDCMEIGLQSVAARSSVLQWIGLQYMYL